MHAQSVLLIGFSFVKQLWAMLSRHKPALAGIGRQRL